MKRDAARHDPVGIANAAYSASDCWGQAWQFTCLIVAGDKPRAESLARVLARYGIKPHIAGSLGRAVRVSRQWHFNGIVVDGDSLGPDWGRQLRQIRSQPDSPLLLLAQDADEHQHLRALEWGATEVLARPASPRLVAMQLRRLMELRAANAEGEHPAGCSGLLRLGDLTLEHRTGRAWAGRRQLEFTASEFALLYLLASRTEEVIDRPGAAMVLGSPALRHGRGADMTVMRLRKKLAWSGLGGIAIETVYGRGYRLRQSATAAGQPAQCAAIDLPDHPTIAPTAPRSSAGFAVERATA